MKLSTAFRLPVLPRLAMVGAGGKSSALICLAKELGENHRTVVITTTTHLGAWQVMAGNEHWMVREDEALDSRGNFPEGIIFITGPLHDDQRYGSLNAKAFAQLYQLAEREHLPLLIEADGARRLPLKAPAMHEPVIPHFVSEVGVCAGLGGLGKPLDGVWVHHPEHFAQLSGLDEGDLITPEAVSRVLMHPLGGLKNIPAQARRILLLSQAETGTQQAQANTIAQQVMQAFHGVVIAALPRMLGEGEEASAIPSQQANIFAVHESIAGVVLAAGGAARYGALKQVLLWKGKPLVRHVTQTALEAGLSPVVVVTGAGVGQVAQAIAGLPVRQVHNPDWQGGQSTSVQAGLRALPPTSGGVVFLLADQPDIPATLVRALVEAHSQSLAPVIAPLVDGQRGNPVLFDPLAIPDLMKLTGDQGGRQIFSQYPIQYVSWQDRAVLRDVDVPEDYARLTSEG
jgi:molybdenum cofactor cytidylyltransferase